jgi:hypothetical protein
MKTLRKSPATHVAAGFVETLFVLATATAISTVVVPNLSRAARDAQLARDHTNARILVDMANSAVAAGYNAPWHHGGDVVHDLLDGANLPDRTTPTAGLRAEDLTLEEVTGAARHIAVDPATRQVTFRAAPVNAHPPATR